MSRDAVRPTRSFRAMGATVVVGGASDVELRAIEKTFAAWDGRFSRFRADSELTRVNRSRADTVIVSPVFARVLRTALSAARATDGLVDPTLGVAIEAAGYDRDFGELLDDPALPGPTARGAWRMVRLAGRVLSRPATVDLDLNGVVKSMAVDASVQLLSGRGFVSAGGDLAVRGSTTVALPDESVVRAHHGGLATSGVTYRRWMRGGQVQHHLIDPRTGRPARSRWTEVAVSAHTCLSADVAAKAAFLLSDDGPDWLDGHGLAGRFLSQEAVVTNRAWRRSLEERALRAAA